MTFLKGVAIVTTSILLSVGLMKLPGIISEASKSNRAERVFQEEMNSAARASKARTEHALATVRAGLITIRRYDRWTGFTVPIHNAGSTPMREVTVTIALHDSRGKWAGSATAEVLVIEPGKTVEASTSEDITGIASASLSCIRWPQGMICDKEGKGIPRIQ